MAATTSRVGLGARPEPVDHLATGGEQELLEVPLHVAGLPAGVGGPVNSAWSGWRSAPLTSVLANSGNVTP